MAGLQEDNKSLKLSLSKVEAERKQAQERSNNLEKVYSNRLSGTSQIHTQAPPQCWTLENRLLFYSDDRKMCWVFSRFMLFAWLFRLPVGKEQPGNRPELQTEDFAATPRAGADWAQGDAGAAHRQIWVYWRSQISCHEWYASPVSEHALRHGFSLDFFCRVLFFF